MKTYLSKGKKTRFLWHFPDNEKHFIHLLETDPVPEYQFKVKRMLEDRMHLLNFDHTLDIGANVGLWTRWFSRHGAKTVDCFEPIAENVECLIENTKDLNGISIHSCALGETAGTLTLYNSATQKNSGASTVDITKHSSSPDLVEQVVECKPLDSLQLSPTFVKIDVQGAEMMVLLGGAQTFKKHKPGLVVECNDNGEILDLLYSWGYKKIMNIGNDALMVAA